MLRANGKLSRLTLLGSCLYLYKAFRCLLVALQLADVCNLRPVAPCFTPLFVLALLSRRCHSCGRTRILKRLLGWRRESLPIEFRCDADQRSATQRPCGPVGECIGSVRPLTWISTSRPGVPSGHGQDGCFPARGHIAFGPPSYPFSTRPPRRDGRTACTGSGDSAMNEFRSRCPETCSDHSPHGRSKQVKSGTKPVPKSRALVCEPIRR